MLQHVQTRGRVSRLPGRLNVLLVFVLFLLVAGSVKGFEGTQGSDTQLFTAVEHEGDSQVWRSVQAPDTTLDLFLQGIVATDDHHLGYAIIRSPELQEWHFRSGDSIFGLARLEEIYIDRVIISRDGNDETLRLPIEFMARDPFLEEARNKEARRIVTDFRKKLLARDGMALIRMFGFDETYGNGGFIGFTVKIVGEDGPRMLEVLGVQEGDVITAVNGKRFAESLEAIESLSTLKDATEVDVEIDRQGVPMFFHFDFDQLEAADDEDAQAASVALEDATAGAGNPRLPEAGLTVQSFLADRSEDPESRVA